MNSITIHNIEKTYDNLNTLKKYIKQAFKTVGLGKIDKIQSVEEYLWNEYVKVTVSLRDTDDEDILENRRCLKSMIEEHGSYDLYTSYTPISPPTSEGGILNEKWRKTKEKCCWVVDIPTDENAYSVEADHAEKLRILNDQSNRAFRLIEEVQASSEKRFECIERELSEQNELIEKLQNENKSLKTKLKGHEVTIYQLLGGLFNQSDQANILSIHLSELHGEDFEDLPKDTSKWSVFPTTRQGDALEKEVAKQAEQIESLVDLLRKTNTTSNKLDASPQGNLIERKMAVFEENLKHIRERLAKPLLEMSYSN
jgi:hypothetical protein